jgi:hypothetical protein
MTYYEAIDVDLPYIGRTPYIYNNVVYALTQKDHIFICSPEDFDLVQDHKISEDAGGYARFGHSIRLLRLLVERINPGGYLDHKDRIKLNYLRENLRPATHQQNMWNQQHHTKERFIGVKKVSNFDKCRRYQASITINNRRISVGTFSNEVDAAYARDRAAVHFHGEHAVLNIPSFLEAYRKELTEGIPPVQKLYNPGIITHPMKYITKAVHGNRWLVQPTRRGVVGRFSSVEEAQIFRDQYLRDHPLT